jgi:hypothetical protein
MLGTHYQMICDRAGVFAAPHWSSVIQDSNGSFFTLPLSESLQVVTARRGIGADTADRFI